MPMLTILEGSTFCLSDERGDIVEETSGLFAYDTRFLSRLVLRLAGSRPLLLSSGRTDHFAAAFFLRNANVDGLPHDTVSVARERFVATGMRERIAVRNEGMETLRFEVSLELAADFADIITVKLHDFALGDPENAPALPPPAPAEYDEGTRQLLIEPPRGDVRTLVTLSQPGRIDDGRMVFDLDLDPHELWELDVEVHPGLDGEGDPERVERLAEERETLGDVVAAWTLRVPRVRGGWESLRRAFDRSIDDLAALRMRTGESRRPLFAAGMPWFMTVFGRDCEITSLQTLLLGPEVATGALDALAELQATTEDPAIDAEPGKIVHEVRRGRAAEFWFPRYYGTVDATPLFLVLLAETWRWTDDARARHPAPRARAARARVDRSLGRPRRRRLRRVRRACRRRPAQPVLEGLGRLATLPRRSLRRASDRAGRGAGLRLPGEARARGARPRGLARARARGPAGVGGRRATGTLRRGVLDRRRGRRLLRARARRGEGEGRRALLEHGPPALERNRAARARRARRRRAPLGVAVVGLGDPHDGPGRGGVQPDQLPQRDRVAARHVDHRVGPRAARLRRGGKADRARADRGRGPLRVVAPEVFAGYARDETPFPIAYPTAARPQAWAAGTPILLVRVLLGLEPDRARQRLVSTVEDELPSWLEGLRVEGVRAFGRSWVVSVERGHVTIAEGV